MFETLIEELTYFIECARDNPAIRFNVVLFDPRHIVIEMIDENSVFATSPVHVETLLNFLQPR